MLPFKRLLLKVTGSIAAYKSCELISLLKSQNPDLEIKVILSNNAHRFVGPEALEALSGQRVHSDIFASGQLMDHIHLARWADATLVYPASANTISNFATGRADDLIGALFLAYDLETKPYFLAPAMNTKMWNHPAQKKAIMTLKDYGVTVLPTESGVLACGEVGLGRLLSPAKTSQSLSTPPTTKTKILITSGATREPIDGVRFLTNFSSGQTGATLAQAFAEQGAHEVTLLHGSGAAQPTSSKIKTIAFTDFADLKEKLFSSLENNSYDFIIQAAAVSDYRVESVQCNSKTYALHEIKSGKLETKGQLQISLKKNSKLISQLRTRSCNRDVKIVGFKLTKTVDAQGQHEAVEKLLQNSSVDFVVHNDLIEIEQGSHSFRIFDSTLKLIGTAEGAKNLASFLQKTLFVKRPTPKSSSLQKLEAEL